MIRLKTIKRLKDTYRSVYRVRRRAYELGPFTLDTDGIDSEPETWARAEEEFYTNHGYALAACNPESDGRGRQGYLDQVTARRVWRLVSEAGMDVSVFDSGRYRLLQPFVVSGERITLT